MPRSLEKLGQVPCFRRAPSGFQERTWTGSSWSMPCLMIRNHLLGMNKVHAALIEVGTGQARRKTRRDCRSCPGSSRSSRSVGGVVVGFRIAGGGADCGVVGVTAVEACLVLAGKERRAEATFELELDTGESADALCAVLAGAAAFTLAAHVPARCDCPNQHQREDCPHRVGIPGAHPSVSAFRGSRAGWRARRRRCSLSGRRGARATRRSVGCKRRRRPPASLHTTLRVRPPCPRR